jgi:uncharacterized protein (TIGR02147 family)
MLKRIEHYADYRQYLREFYEDRKQQVPGYSYRVFCRKSGIKSPSLFIEVIQGKRNLTRRTIPAFVKGLGLTDTDASFFAQLVAFNQSTTSEEKQGYLERMRGLRRPVKQKIIPLDQREYFAKWYNPVLRESACIFDWHEDFSLLARSLDPPISTREARNGVSLLLRLGMIVKKNDGKYVQADQAITTGPEVVSDGVRMLNRQLSTLGVEAVERFSPAHRDISSMVIGVSPQTFSLIKQEILEFRRRIARITDDEKNPDQVYNVNVHFFPTSKKAAKREGPDE